MEKPQRDSWPRKKTFGATRPPQVSEQGAVTQASAIGPATKPHSNALKIDSVMHQFYQASAAR